jgi:signal transduction histidine kinase
MRFSKKFDRIFFIAVLLALLGLSFLLYKRVQELVESYNQVNHTNIVQLKLESTFSNIKDAEAAQRGFLLTRDSVFLEPFYGAHKKTDILIAELIKLTEDNPRQQKNFKELQQLTELRFSRLERSLSLYQNLSKEELHNRLLTGKKVMDSIRYKINLMVDAEDDLLKQREKIKDENASIAPIAVLLLVILSLLILLFYFSRITRQLSISQEFADELQRKNKELDLKNQQLEKSNEELNSFNYIASHDLREPLRKIRTYNSISLSDQSKFKENTVKIESAINRMQNLLNDLLSYSRISMSERKMEEVNLNEVLVDVIEVMSDQINESGAQFQYNHLPTIKGIQTQLQQLFENLLSNAIKYRKEDVAPVVKISCELVNKNKLPEPSKATQENYYFICFSDNGIGFEQKYAEKVFELFQRLHSRAAYSGTGIGLTICRKIVENHQGFITAESEVGKGTDFCIYLPA